MSVRPEGITLEPAEIDDVPLVLEFDAASFVLTAMGRVNAGTARGDSAARRALREPLLPDLILEPILERQAPGTGKVTMPSPSGAVRAKEE